VSAACQNARGVSTVATPGVTFRAAPLVAASISLDVLNVFLLLLSLFNRR
jgi:hypothetical protein